MNNRVTKRNGLGGTKLSFTQQHDLSELCKCRVTKHKVLDVELLKRLVQLKELVTIMLGVLGGVKEINTKEKHGRGEVAEGGKRAWDVLL